MGCKWIYFFFLLVKYERVSNTFFTSEENCPRSSTIKSIITSNFFFSRISMFFQFPADDKRLELKHSVPIWLCKILCLKIPLKMSGRLQILHVFALFLIYLRVLCQIFSMQKILYYMMSNKGPPLHCTMILFLFQYQN